MKVDPEIEEPLRRAIVAVVGKESKSISSALHPLDEKSTGIAVGYATFVVGYIMHDVFTTVDLGAAESMAETLVERESLWVDVGSQHQVAAFLLACAKGGEGLDDVNPDDPIVFATVIAGYLLAHYRPKDTRWFEYLDQIWDYAESQPDPAQR